MTDGKQVLVARQINANEKPYAIINPNGRFGDEIVTGYLTEPDARRLVLAWNSLDELTLLLDDIWRSPALSHDRAMRSRIRAILAKVKQAE